MNRIGQHVEADLARITGWGAQLVTAQN